MKKLYILQTFAACMLLVTSAYSQITNQTNTATPATEFVGWNNAGTAKPLDIINNSTTPNNIDMYINTVKYLQVLTSGDLNLVVPTNSFMINNNPVLRHNGDVTSILVGVNAGNATMTGLDNTLVGNGAGASLTTGSKNTFIGYDAGESQTTGTNVAVGYEAMKSNVDLIYNTAVGYQALYTNNNCPLCWSNYGLNTAMGYQALYSSEAYGGCAFGYRAGYSNDEGCSLTAIGENAAINNLNGNDNTAIGASAFTGNTDLNANVAVGAHALESQNYSSGSPTSSFNVAVGNYSLRNTNPTSTTNGINYTAIGYVAGFTNTTGKNNTYLGFTSDAATGTLDNVTTVGANAQAKTSNSMILGDNVVNVGIGFSGVTGGPLAKLDIKRAVSSPQIANPTGAKIDNVDVDVAGNYLGKAYGLNSAVYGINLKNYGGLYIAENANTNYGGWYETVDAVSGSSNVNNKAIYLHSANGTNNYGLQSVTSNGTNSLAGRFEVNNAVTNYGVSVLSTGGTTTTVTNFGVNSEAIGGTNTTFNVAVYGKAAVNPAGPLPAANTGTYAGYFNGDLAYTGQLGVPSDANLKTDVTPIANAGDILSELNTYSYYYDTLQFGSYVNFPKSLQYGLLAQELEVVAPNLVLNSTLPPKIDSLGNIVIAAAPIKMINYVGLIPILIKGYNEEKEKNEELETRLAALEDAVASCCGTGLRNSGSNGNGMKNSLNMQQLTTELANSNAIILNQNDPNPFAENTTITWSIPEEELKGEALNAMIIFYNNNGSVLNTVKINATGEGSLLVYGNNLMSGIYRYSLVVSGKTISTKQMVKAR